MWLYSSKTSQISNLPPICWESMHQYVPYFYLESSSVRTLEHGFTGKNRRFWRFFGYPRAPSASSEGVWGGFIKVHLSFFARASRVQALRHGFHAKWNPIVRFSVAPRISCPRTGRPRPGQTDLDDPKDRLQVWCPMSEPSQEWEAIPAKKGDPVFNCFSFFFERLCLLAEPCANALLSPGFGAPVNAEIIQLAPGAVGIVTLDTWSNPDLAAGCCIS